jgi:hypothetical protein
MMFSSPFGAVLSAEKAIALDAVIVLDLGDPKRHGARITY